VLTTISGAVVYLIQHLANAVGEYIFYILAYLVLAGFIGFGISYKYPLNPLSKKLLVITIRFISFCLIFFAGTNSFVISGVLCLLLMSPLYYMITWPLFLCCPCFRGSDDDDRDEYFISDEERKEEARRLRNLSAFQEDDDSYVGPVRVVGASHCSTAEYDREGAEYTRIELAKLRNRLQQGGDFVSTLTPASQRRVSRFVSDADVSENIDGLYSDSR